MRSVKETPFGLNHYSIFQQIPEKLDSLRLPLLPLSLVNGFTEFKPLNYFAVLLYLPRSFVYIWAESIVLALHTEI